MAYRFILYTLFVASVFFLLFFFIHIRITSMWYTTRKNGDDDDDDGDSIRCWQPTRDAKVAFSWMEIEVHIAFSPLLLDSYATEHDISGSTHSLTHSISLNALKNICFLPFSVWFCACRSVCVCVSVHFYSAGCFFCFNEKLLRVSLCRCVGRGALRWLLVLHSTFTLLFPLYASIYSAAFYLLKRIERHRL